MKTDVFYVFSPRALKAMGVKWEMQIPWRELPVAPVSGDLISLAEFPSLSFVVGTRRFHWSSGDVVGIYVGLDLHTEADDWVRAGS